MAVKLKALEAKLRQQYSNYDLGYDAWHNGAMANFLPGVFVWLDEFETAFQADLENTDFSDKQPGVDELTLTPMLDADTRAMVMEGFETRPMVTAQETGTAAKIEAAQGATTKDGDRVARTGRPQTIRKKAEIVRQIVDAFELVAEKQFDVGALPGSAVDLLDACQRIERSLTGKTLMMETSSETFKGWLRTAGYSFPNGRTPKTQATFWTHLAPIATGKITAGVFTEVIPEKPL